MSFALFFGLLVTLTSSLNVTITNKTCIGDCNYQNFICQAGQACELRCISNSTTDGCFGIQIYATSQVPSLKIIAYAGNNSNFRGMEFIQVYSTSPQLTIDCNNFGCYDVSVYSTNATNVDINCNRINPYGDTYSSMCYYMQLDIRQTTGSVNIDSYFSSLGSINLINNKKVEVNANAETGLNNLAFTAIGNTEIALNCRLMYSCQLLDSLRIINNQNVYLDLSDEFSLTQSANFTICGSTNLYFDWVPRATRLVYFWVCSDNQNVHLSPLQGSNNPEITQQVEYTRNLIDYTAALNSSANSYWVTDANFDDFGRSIKCPNDGNDCIVRMDSSIQSFKNYFDIHCPNSKVQDIKSLVRCRVYCTTALGCWKLNLTAINTGGLEYTASGFGEQYNPMNLYMLNDDYFAPDDTNYVTINCFNYIDCIQNTFIFDNINIVNIYCQYFGSCFASNFQINNFQKLVNLVSYQGARDATFKIIGRNKYNTSLLMSGIDEFAYRHAHINLFNIDNIKVLCLNFQSCFHTKINISNSDNATVNCLGNLACSNSLTIDASNSNNLNLDCNSNTTSCKDMKIKCPGGYYNSSDEPVSCNIVCHSTFYFEKKGKQLYQCHDLDIYTSKENKLGYNQVNLSCTDEQTSCHSVDVYCGKKFDCSCKVQFDNYGAQECKGKCGTKTCSGSSSNSNNSTGPIIGVVVAVVVICLIAFCIYRRRRKRQGPQSQPFNNNNGYQQYNQPQQTGQYGGTNGYYGKVQQPQKYNM